MVRHWVWLMVMVTLVLAGCGADDAQVRRCRALLPAFEAAPGTIEVVRAAPDPSEPGTVRIDYRSAGPDGVAGERWIACRFAGSGTDAGRLDLTGVATDRTGALGAIGMLFLERTVEMPRRSRRPAALPERITPEPSLRLHLLYLLQQAINATALGCVYGLLAIGYSLVYAVIGRINLAFGGLLTAGAYISVIAVALSGMAGLGTVAAVLLGVLVLAMGAVALQGGMIETWVFRRVRTVSGQAPLVVSLGVAIAVSEAVRLLQGARDRWLAPPFPGSVVVAEMPGFAVTVTIGQILIVILSLALFAGLMLLLARSALGRALRACADDASMAALLGLDVGRTIAASFALGGAFAAAAGFVMALHYGGVNFFMGWQVGFKALTAAVVGGIGSIPGAMLGGALIGLIETSWAAYFDLAYKEIAVFGLLAAFLLFRPHGLLGQPRGRGD
ncbi:MAG TPA: branched-chain amino acid ABC transporter permease [Arenibaculum sp.]|nr:branched-chain amino acid ABC transporter permease [Arenibaculum sp.]